MIGLENKEVEKDQIGTKNSRQKEDICGIWGISRAFLVVSERK